MTEQGEKFVEIIRARLHPQLAKLWDGMASLGEERPAALLRYIHQFVVPMFIKTIPDGVFSANSGEEIADICKSKVLGIVKEFVDLKTERKIIVPFGYD